jgi:hypothetical protein
VEKAHIGDVNCVRWRAGGAAGPQLLASAGDDGLIKIWTLA